MARKKFFLANPTGTPTDGQRLTVRLTSAATQTLAYGNKYRAGATYALPIATSIGGKTDYLFFVYNAAATKWDLVNAALGF